MDDPSRTTTNPQQNPAIRETQQLEEKNMVLRLWDEFAPAMLRHALAATGDRETSREVVQDAFTAVLGRIRTGDHLADWKLTLYESLIAAIQLRTPAQEVSSEIPAAPDSHFPDLDAPLRAAEVRGELMRLVSSREFEMLQLRAEGLSYIEIASVLSISPGTVASSLARAFRKIRIGYSGGKPW